MSPWRTADSTVGGWVASVGASFGQDLSENLLWSGDPYVRDPDRIPRGISLAVEPSAVGWDGHCTAVSVVEPSVAFEFSPTDVPPSQPQDPSFHLPSTTLFLRRPSACQLGNDLLAFLRDYTAASILKLSCKKFTIKAEAHISGMPLTVKLRVYGTGDGAFVVEVQRRVGDGVAFAVLFARLCQYLEPHSQHTQPQNRLAETRGCATQALLD